MDTATACAVLALLLAAGCAVFCLILRRRMRNAIRLIGKTAEEMARGRLERRIELDGNPELIELANSLNLMAENLSLMIKERDDAGEALVLAYREMEDNNRTLEQEIFAHMEAERSLLESKDKFATAFRCSADVIGIVRASDMRNLELSDAFFSKFGYGPDEVFGRSSAEFGLWLHPRERAEYWRQLFEKKRVRDVETHWRAKNGTVRVGTMAGDVIELGGDRCVLFTWHDITERKKAEDALREANEQLERKVAERTQELQGKNEELAQLLEELQRAQEFLLQSEKMVAMTNLVVGVSHELNTPLGVAITLASHLEERARQFAQRAENEKLRKSELTDFVAEEHEAADMLLKNLHRVAKLIGTFKQVSVDQLAETRRPFNLRLQLEEILQSLAPVLQKGGHHLTIECEPEEEWDGFPGALTQVIANLINNSLLHAYDAGQIGKIVIRAERIAGQLQLTYQDDGRGVDEDVLGKIFNPFFTTRRGQGAMGLGLCIVYNLVTQQFGGTIDCWSRPGEGMRIVLTLPEQSIDDA